jgi:hypothetical protein
MLPAAAPRAGIQVSRQRLAPLAPPGNHETGRTEATAPASEQNCFRGNPPGRGALVAQAQRARPLQSSAAESVLSGGS